MVIAHTEDMKMLRLTEDEIIAEASKDKEYCQLAVDVGMWAAREQMKRLLLGISKETKKLDQTTYLVPDYTKFKEALEEVGL